MQASGPEVIQKVKMNIKDLISASITESVSSSSRVLCSSSALLMLSSSTKGLIVAPWRQSSGHRATEGLQTWIQMVDMTSMRAVTTNMSAAPTTSLDVLTSCHPASLLPVDHLDQREADATPEPPVGHDELFLQVYLLESVPGEHLLKEEG